MFATAFRDGMLAGGLVFLLLLGWMALRAGDTAWKLQSQLPVKTAAIEEKFAEPVTPVEKQPGLADAKNLNALPPAPIDGLYENFEGRQLPIIRIQDDLTPFNAYKKPFQAVAGRPRVSIVAIDFGLSAQLSKSILDNLSADITLALNPYADEPAKWAAAARAYGREFWLMLPLQTKDYGTDDSGPATLLLNGSEEANRARLFTVLGEAAGYAGVVAQPGHEFTSAAPTAAPVLKQIFGRGLGFADSNAAGEAFGETLAAQDGYPYARNNLWLDESLRSADIDRALGELELMATRNGKAVAFLHPYPAVMTKVQEWIDGAEAKGIQVAPLSAMVE